MRTLLLATAGLLVASGSVYAEDYGRRHRTVEDYYAAALAVNIGGSSGNEAITAGNHAASASMTGGFNGMRGVANVNQNSGSNSAQQNSVAVAYVEGCDCEVTVSRHDRRSRGDADANAVAANAGRVSGNTSVNGVPIFSGGGSASASMSGAYQNATGIVQSNQNAGANSAQQNATAVVYVDGIRGAVQDRDAWAISANIGGVTENTSGGFGHNASGTIADSFTGFTGAANVNQNAGANSLQQNATALSAITYCNCATQDLSTTIAAAGNFGRVSYNGAAAVGGSSSTVMNNSFNNATGVAQVNQNAGANSLMQNSVSVGAIYQR